MNYFWRSFGYPFGALCRHWIYEYWNNLEKTGQFIHPRHTIHTLRERCKKITKLTTPTSSKTKTGKGVPRGLQAARKLRTHRRDQRWADNAYKKRLLGTAFKSSPFAGASHAKGIVLEKMYVSILLVIIYLFSYLFITKNRDS